MGICPKCKAENVFSGAQFCRNCGAPLVGRESAADTIPIKSEQDDDLEFVITETHGPSAPDFLGHPELSSEEGTKGSDDTLEISEAADLLNMEQDTVELPDRGAENSTSPINPYSAQTEPISPDKPREKPHIPTPDWGSESSSKPSESQEASAGQKPDEASFEKNHVAAKNILSTNREETVGETVKPIADPARQAATTQRIQKARGLAYFRNNVIRLAGKPFLHEGDEITINNRSYMLRPGKMGKKVKLGLFAAAVVIVLLGIASQFVKPPLSGDGEIVGLILDKKGQPYLEGARIDILPLNKSTTSNAQGFFRFELIPPGTYELTYELGDQYVGGGNVTVTAGQMTLMTFNRLEPRAFAEKKKSEPPQVTPETSKSAGTPQQKSRLSSGKETSSRYGKIRLEANVENARLILDGKVLGAGNTTYTRIKDGQHTITVNKAGYSEYTEIVRVRADETITIRASLVRQAKSAAENLSADNFLSLGRDALSAGDVDGAIEDFSKAIDLSPGLSEAYLQRAEAYELAGKIEKASDDCVRAGEIYRISGDNSRAIDAFSSALKLFPESATALVGRAGALLDNGEYRWALNDYEVALKKEKDFYPALYGAGICYFSLGDYKKAEKHFKKAQKQNSSDPYLYHYLLLTYLGRDDVKNLRKTYAQFKEIATPVELAELKSSGRFEPVIRLIKEEDR